MRGNPTASGSAPALVPTHRPACEFLARVSRGLMALLLAMLVLTLLAGRASAADGNVVSSIAAVDPPAADAGAGPSVDPPTPDPPLGVLTGGENPGVPTEIAPLDELVSTTLTRVEELLGLVTGIVDLPSATTLLHTIIGMVEPLAPNAQPAGPDAQPRSDAAPADLLPDTTPTAGTDATEAPLAVRPHPHELAAPRSHRPESPADAPMPEPFGPALPVQLVMAHLAVARSSKGSQRTGQPAGVVASRAVPTGQRSVGHMSDTSPSLSHTTHQSRARGPPALAQNPGAAR